MNYKMLITIFLVCTMTLSAFKDNDIDGVDDSIDLCPNTPFNELVDKNGCSSSQKNKNNSYHGIVTLKVGTTLRTDDIYDDDSYLNFYANYLYKNFDISVSNTQSTTTNDDSEDNSYSDSDIYVSLGYSFSIPHSKIRLSAGTKIVDDSSDNNVISNSRRYTSIEEDDLSDSRDNDYFAGINYSYFLNSKQDIFLYYGYTKSGDSSTYDYQDYSSFSIGTGYLFTPSIYSAISYSYTGSVYEDVDAEERIGIYGTYNLNKNFFIIASYSYGLDDDSYDNAFSLSLGLTF